MCYLLGILQCKIELCKMGKKLISWIIIILGWAAVVRTGANVVRLYKAGDRVTEAKKELAIELQKNEELKRQLANVQTPEYMERLAREKLGYGKEGELVVVIDPNELKVTPSASSGQANEEQVPNWLQWRKLWLGF
jgi:cell division protein FtsB